MYYSIRKLIKFLGAKMKNKIKKITVNSLFNSIQFNS